MRQALGRACRCSMPATVRCRMLRRCGRICPRAELAKPSPKDYSLLAKVRLRNLLAGAGDGYVEVLQSQIASLSPSFKCAGWIALSLGGGAFAFAPVGFMDLLLGYDPIGELVSSVGLQLGAAGILAAVPLAGLAVLAWQPAVRSQIPGLSDLQEEQLELHAPLLRGMSTMQGLACAGAAGLAITLVVVPGIYQHARFAAALTDQLPSIVRSGQVISLRDAISQVVVPEDATSIGIPMVLAGLCAGVSEAVLHLSKVSEAERKIVQDAVENADRYYRLTVMSSSNSVGDAEQAAQAFKAVAERWLNRSGKVALLAVLLNTSFMVYLAMLYNMTQSFAAPATAAMVATAVHWHLLTQHIPELVGKER